jgi:hypothetical protein
MGSHHVDVRAGGEVAGVSRSDLEIDSVPVRRLAEPEFSEAAACFERESLGLGAAFIDAVEVCRLLSPELLLRKMPVLCHPRGAPA